MDEELDEFERTLFYCIDKVYRQLREEKAYLLNKLIDKSFSYKIDDVISELFRARYDIHGAYKKRRTKLTNK